MPVELWSTLSPATRTLAVVVSSKHPIFWKFPDDATTVGVGVVDVVEIVEVLLVVLVVVSVVLVGGGGIVIDETEVVEVDEGPGLVHWLLPHICPGLHALHKSPISHWMLGKSQHTAFDV
jgi:hypothetical protein